MHSHSGQSNLAGRSLYYLSFIFRDDLLKEIIEVINARLDSLDETASEASCSEEDEESTSSEEDDDSAEESNDDFQNSGSSEEADVNMDSGVFSA
jgi:hypothetical protein